MIASVKEHEKNVLLLELDYTLMELHEALEDQDDMKAFDLKDKLSSLRLQLIEVGHY